MNLIKRGIGIVIMLTGIGIFLYPYMADALLDYKTGQFIQKFNETYGVGTLSDEEELGIAESEASEAGQISVETEAGLSGTDSDFDTVSSGISAAEKEKLYQQCLAYNQQIYKDAQAGLCDAWSYEQASIDMEFSDLEAFGYIEIPAMDLVLPLYLGASTENMAKGATILGQTSLPIGGENTNAVIAAHRGYRGAAYFREIEKLSVGDMVYVTNPWGTLTYVVTAIDVISPSDVDAVKIQEGKDIITLLTCHPYRSHGKYRYVVYCERGEDEAGNADVGYESGGQGDDSGSTGTVAASRTDGNTITASDGNIYELSERDIEFERIFRMVCAGLIVIIMLFSFLFSRKRETTSAYDEGPSLR